MIRRLFAATAVLAVAACSGIDVHHDFNPQANFGQLQTFDWMPASEAEGNATNHIRDRRFQDALEAELGGKGFRKVSSGADFLVGYHITLDNQVDYTAVNTYWGPRWGYGGVYPGAYGGMGTTQVTAHGYVVGTLIVDVFEVSSEELVWRGVGEGRVEQDWSPAERDEKARRAVQAILADFPPNG